MFSMWSPQGHKGSIRSRIDWRVGPIYNCAVCGWYSVSLEFAQDVELSNEIRAGLSAGSRQEYEKKTRRLFIITKQNYQGLPFPLNRPFDH